MTSVSLDNGAELELFPAAPVSRGTVIICPGGAYRFLSPREGGPVAEAFRRAGYSAAVLAYSVRPDSSAPALGTGPLFQLGEAVRFLKNRNPDEPVFVCGFSAGGHLAASLGVHGREFGLPVPDALILCYPVITAGEYTNAPTIQNICDNIGKEYWSLERYVTKETPPCFLWHTVEDAEAPVWNSLLMAEALSRAGCSYELHLYPRGVHGLSLATEEVNQPEKNRLADPHVASWLDACVSWMELAVPETGRSHPLSGGQAGIEEGNDVFIGGSSVNPNA